jgi:hypothetical protein
MVEDEPATTTTTPSPTSTDWTATTSDPADVESGENE